MGVKIAFGSRSNSGGEQMNGGSQMNGGQYQNNGQPMQNHPQMAMPQMNGMGGPQMNGMGGPQMNGMGGGQMNGGGQAMAYGMAASYPVQHGPYVPGHHVPAPTASQMGYLAPLSEMGPEGMYPDYLGEEMRRGRSRSTGRYVHRSAMDGGEQMRGAGGGSGGYSMGHAESDEDEDGGEVMRLKKKIKKLSRKMQKLEEELEEKEEQGRKKKKKSKHEDEDDEDEEDDPQKKLGCALSSLIPSLPGLAEQVFNVVASPPGTWADYLKKQDFSGIAKMEFSELLKAVQEGKPLPDLKKEIFHTLAGLLMVCGKKS